ncbi:MAG: MATE family efflux transporter [Hungatella sp.]|nr:MATE family efflux transporter [Hungatella sp.]
MNLEEIKGNPAKKIMEFSVPAIISMMLTAFITVADGFFMGNYVGKEGIAAVNLGLPIVYLYLGVGLMVSIGGVAMAGMCLGGGDREGSNQIFRQTIAVTALLSLIISCAMVFGLGPMLLVFKAEREVGRYFEEYYRIMLLALPAMVINSSLGMFIRGDGNPQFYLKVTVLNVVLNVFMDYGAAVCLGLGAAGIALSSCLSALVSMGCLFWYFLKKSEIYHLGTFQFSWRLCVRGILNGSSEFIGEMSTGIAMFAYNFVIMRMTGADGVAAFTIIGYTAYLFGMVIVGFGQGASPLISFCYGAREKRAAAEIRSRTSRYVFGAGAAVLAVMTALRGWYGGLFVSSEEVKAMVEEGMLVFMASFLFSGINSITSFYFTATGRAFESAVISFARGLVILLACIFVLPALFGMKGVWMAAPVTEVLTLGITVWFLCREKQVL